VGCAVADGDGKRTVKGMKIRDFRGVTGPISVPFQAD
jgi:hypothetical protein